MNSTILKRRELALRLARRSATILRKNFSLSAVMKWKEDQTPVTASDLASNWLIVRGLHKAFPNDTIISEEEEMIQGTSGDAWVIDPLDGTIPFTHGIPTFTVSIAWVRNGVPTIGVIIDPILRREFVGVKGAGATLNGARLRTTVDRVRMAPATVFTEGWSRSPIPLHKANEIIYEEFSTISLASMTYDAMIVATGNAGAALYPGLFPWDIVAVKVIVEEAGGIVRDIYGHEQRYDQPIRGAIIATKQTYPRILQILQQTLPSPRV